MTQSTMSFSRSKGELLEVSTRDHDAAGEDTPLLNFMKNSRTPLSPSIVELSLYQDVAAGIDGKGGQAGTFLRAKKRTIFVLNCSLIAHGVVLIPQLFVYFVRNNVLLKYLNILMALNIVSMGILTASEWAQVIAMKTPLTFRRRQRCAERGATTCIVVLTAATTCWTCLTALDSLHNEHLLLVFDHRDAVILLVLSAMIFITALSGLLCVAIMLLPTYRALWEEQHRNRETAPNVDVFGNLHGNNVSHSTTEL